MNPLRDKTYEDSSQIEEQIERMLHNFYHMVAVNGLQMSAKAYREHFYRMFNEEFLKLIKTERV